MTVKLRSNLWQSCHARERTPGGKVSPVTALAAPRSNPLFVPYQGVIR